MGTAIKHPVPDRVKPQFVIFDIWALWHSGLSVRVPGCKNYRWRIHPVWYRMLYSCTHYGNHGRQRVKTEDIHRGIKSIHATCVNSYRPSETWLMVNTSRQSTRSLATSLWKHAQHTTQCNVMYKIWQRRKVTEKLNQRCGGVTRWWENYGEVK